MPRIIKCQELSSLRIRSSSNQKSSPGKWSLSLLPRCVHRGGHRCPAWWGYCLVSMTTRTIRSLRILLANGLFLLNSCIHPHLHWAPEPPVMPGIFLITGYNSQQWMKQKSLPTQRFLFNVFLFKFSQDLGVVITRLSGNGSWASSAKSRSGSVSIVRVRITVFRNCAHHTA